VSLGWGGWIGTFDSPGTGGGRSLIPHFADVMQMSDFQSFQAMASEKDGNPAQIRTMVNLLRPYGPVMCAHYQPDNQSQTVFESDMRTILTDAFIGEITNAGLFSFSFMSNGRVDANPSMFQFVKSAVTRYGRGP
jgi:hypothetical protein